MSRFRRAATVDVRAYFASVAELLAAEFGMAYTTGQMPHAMPALGRGD